MVVHAHPHAQLSPRALGALPRPAGGAPHAASPDPPQPGQATATATLRERAWEVLDNPTQSRLGGFVAKAMMLVIVASMLALVLESATFLRDIDLSVWMYLDACFVCVFSLEFTLRVLACPSLPSFFRDVLNWTDMFAIFPFYVGLALSGGLSTTRDSDTGTGPFRVLRVFRLARVFRIFKIGRYSTELAVFTRTVRKSVSAVAMILLVLVLLVIVAASILYELEHNEVDRDNTQFSSIPAAMWWASITIATVGYGDMTPQTPAGKVVACIVMLIGTTSLALPVSIIGSNCVHEYDQAVQQKRFLQTRRNTMAQVPQFDILGRLSCCPAPLRPAGDRVFGWLEGEGRVGSSVLAVLFVTILVSVAGIVLETVPALEFLGDLWKWVEITTVSLFTAEVVVRVLVCPSVGRYLADWMNAVDLLAILPFYVDALFGPFGTTSTAVLRIFRLLRVTKLFKVSRHTPGMVVFAEAFRHSGSALMMLALVLFVELMLFSTALFELESGTWDSERKEFVDADGERAQFQSIIVAFYWTASTITTVGYGDIYPHTALGKVAGAAAALFGVVGITLPMTVIGVNFCNAYEDFCNKKRFSGGPKQELLQNFHRDMTAAKRLLAHRYPMFVQRSEGLNIHLDYGRMQRVEREAGVGVQQQQQQTQSQPPQPHKEVPLEDAQL